MLSQPPARQLHRRLRRIATRRLSKNPYGNSKNKPNNCRLNHQDCLSLHIRVSVQLLSFY